MQEPLEPSEPSLLERLAGTIGGRTGEEIKIQPGAPGERYFQFFDGLMSVADDGNGNGLRLRIIRTPRTGNHIESLSASGRPPIDDTGKRVNFRLEAAAIENFVEGLPALSKYLDDSATHFAGEGGEQVYVYTLASYEELARLQGKPHFRHKIGAAVYGYRSRIRQQLGTSNGERAVVKLVFRSRDCFALEKYFHSVLTLSGRHIDDAPGTEWFLTSTDELRRLWERLGGLLDEGVG